MLKIGGADVSAHLDTREGVGGCERKTVAPMAYAEMFSSSPRTPSAPDHMSIERLLQERVFEPEIISAMSGAYERALRALGLADRTDPVTELLAQTVLSIVETGVRDIERIYDLTMAALKVDRAP